MSAFLNNLKSSLLLTKEDNAKNENVQTTGEEGNKTCESEQAEIEASQGGVRTEKLIAAQIASKMFGIAVKASTKLQEKATNISEMICDIEKERQKFIGELQKERCKDEIGLGELLANPEAQKHIVSISLNTKNFTEDPPLAVNLEAAVPVIKSYADELFKLDPRLKDVRFDLVPKQVSEEKFWQNYTYRISLIRKFLDERPAEHPTDVGKGMAGGTGGESAKGDAITEVDEEQLLNDLEEFEVVNGGSKGAEDKADEELDKEIDELLEN